MRVVAIAPDELHPRAAPADRGVSSADERDLRAPATQRSAWEPRVVALVVGLLCGLFLVNASSWLAAGFGESHDGRNAATWASGSRAIREDGPIQSRFGGRYRGEQYASHPPGILAETTAAELVGGEHRLVTRAPAWLGSIAAAALLALLLWDLGMSAGAIALGLGVTLSSAMFLVYGTMLDTPITALPFALAAVVAAQRTIDGRGPRRIWLAVLGFAVGLSGWVAVVIVAAQVIRLALPSARRANGWRPAAALASGTGLGVVLSLTWGLWAYGSFATMHAKLTDKVSSATLAHSLARQFGDLQDLYAVAAALAVVGAVVALATLPDRRWIGPCASTFGAVALYAVAFRGGAEMHDYWNYPILVPIALAIAAGAEGLLRRAPAEGRTRVQVAVTALALLVALASSTRYSDAEARLVNALATPRLLQTATRIAPKDGPVMAYVGTRGLESSWIPYESRRPLLALRSTAQIESLAARDPGFPMLVAWVQYPTDVQGPARRAAYAVDGPYALVPASFVLAHHTGP